MSYVKERLVLSSRGRQRLSSVGTSYALFSLNLLLSAADKLLREAGGGERKV